MKTLIVVLALLLEVPAYGPSVKGGQCDAAVSSCMPVITRTRVLMVST